MAKKDFSRIQTHVKVISEKDVIFVKVDNIFIILFLISILSIFPCLNCVVISIMVIVNVFSCTLVGIRLFINVWWLCMVVSFRYSYSFYFILINVATKFKILTKKSLIQSLKIAVFCFKMLRKQLQQSLMSPYLVLKW